MRAAPKTRQLVVLPLLGMLFLPAGAGSADAPSSRPPVRTAPPRAAFSSATPRPLSRRDIYQAIQNYLERRGVALRTALRPDDLRIQASVPVASEEAGLAVKRVRFDSLRGETVFELWTYHAPQYLPFTVTTRRAPESWGLSPAPQDQTVAGREASASPLHPASGGTGPKLPVLAQPGQPATLVMLGQNLRVTTTVIPLQPGTKGQCILVRDSTSARVMKAEVVDTGLLQIRL